MAQLILAAAEAVSAMVPVHLAPAVMAVLAVLVMVQLVTQAAQA
jgi:hypothetical protein